MLKNEGIVSRQTFGRVGLEIRGRVYKQFASFVIGGHLGGRFAQHVEERGDDIE